MAIFERNGIRVEANSPDEAETKFAAIQAQEGGKPILSTGGAPSTIGPTPKLDRDLVSGRNLLGKDSTLTMRDLVNGVPNMLATAASFTPLGAAGRVGMAGLLGLGGGGIRDAIRTAMGESPKTTPTERVVYDAGGAALGQGIGEGVSALARTALPPVSAAGASKATLDLGLPVGPVSDAPLARMYTNRRANAAVNQAGTEIRSLLNDFGPKVSPTEGGAMMRDITGEARRSVEAGLQRGFQDVEGRFAGQGVDAAASLDRARALPKQFPGVSVARRELGRAEIPAGVERASNLVTPSGAPASAAVAIPRKVEVPFEDLRGLSKGLGKTPMRGALEGDVTAHMQRVDPNAAARYGALKSSYKNDLVNTFDRGVVGRVFKDPQQVEAVMRIPGSAPARLAAVKKAIFAHPNPAVVKEAWATFKNAKVNQLMEGGPAAFSRKLDSWDPQALKTVFEGDAGALYRIRDLSRALEAQPEQAAALAKMIQDGKPPNFRLSDKTELGRALKWLGRDATGAVLGVATGHAAGPSFVAAEAVNNIFGLINTIAVHNPKAGVAGAVNAFDTVVKSGRTAPLWQLLSSSIRISNARRKRLAATEEEQGQ